VLLRGFAGRVAAGIAGDAERGEADAESVLFITSLWGDRVSSTAPAMSGSMTEVCCPRGLCTVVLGLSEFVAC
jgi:hypothetical protein